MFQRLALLLVTAGLLVLAGCDAPQTPVSATPPTLTGYWKSSYGDGFEVTATTFTQYDDATKAISWAGVIQGKPDLTAAAGGLTLKITNGGSWKKTVDRYYVIRWKALTATGVKESSASLYPATTPEPDTQAGAEAAFTDSAFSFFGDYARQ